MDKRYIFLDVDGVLNRNETEETMCGYPGIDDNLASLLKEMIERTGALVILTSTWREDKNALGYLKDRLSEYGVFIYDVIDGNNKNSRAEEIGSYLSEHPEIAKYVILDDEKPSEDLKDRWIRTALSTGLIPSDTEAAVTILN